MLPQQYCLRWKYHHSNLQTMFSQLLDRGCFCDVTLACEGQLIRAHRVVLCACSTFFDTVLSNYASERDPIIIMKDVTFADVKCLIEFMYKGEINVEHAHLASLLKTADDLKIKGLAEVTWRDDDDGPTPPTPATEFYSPSQEAAYAHEMHHRATPPCDERRDEHRPLTPPPLDARKLQSLPVLTPIPTSSSIAIAAAAAAAAATATPPEQYLNPKRKRGRPPLDDAYDVFNIRKLAHYASQMEHQAYMDAQHYAEEQRQQTATVASTATGVASMSPTSATVAYKQHVQQQQSKQRMRQRQKRSISSDIDHDESQLPGPEWITSNLEVNVSDNTTPTTEQQHGKETEIENKSNKLEQNENDTGRKKSETKQRQEKSAELRERGVESTIKRKNSHVDQQQTDPLQSDEEAAEVGKQQTEDETEERPTVPRPVEEMESVQQVLEQQQQQRLPLASESTSNPSSRQSSPATSQKGGCTTSTAQSSSLPPPPLHHAHFGKFAPEGYLLNEHGMLMTHDAFVHAPTANIPIGAAGSAASNAAAAAAAANGSDPEFVDIKMEDYDAADLRLTSEEMSQWQDVIKMDDYLAKGRRPQFWEEPFTRRVLDAIKNKRLEMKKAARILGVSYGTLYGRYREVYGCLKHPYSNSSTGYRPSSSQLAVQPRFDIVWPTAKRDGTGLLPGPLEIGKLRPKDLTELWARPQI